MIHNVCTPAVLLTSPVRVSSLVSDDGSKVKGVGEDVGLSPRVADVAEGRRKVRARPEPRGLSFLIHRTTGLNPGLSNYGALQERMTREGDESCALVLSSEGTIVMEVLCVVLTLVCTVSRLSSWSPWH